MSETSDERLKFIAGADPFGCALKDTLVSRLRSLDIEVQDLGTDNYYTIGSKVGHLIRGLLACGTGVGVGVGVAIFANKFPGVYAATCLSPADAVNARSISNVNVIAVSGTSNSPETAIETLNSFINTQFKSPCPASKWEPWPDNVQSFLNYSISPMSKIGTTTSDSQSLAHSCLVCSLASRRSFSPIDVMPGGSMEIIRENPTSAVVRFVNGSVEPAHHHSYGHDVVVLKGRKMVWNLSKNERYELKVGDYLFTPAGDVHRVKYLEDTEFFIRWDGRWDIRMDEDLATATSSIEKEM